jgi:hypothetical protein
MRPFLSTFLAKKKVAENECCHFMTFWVCTVYSHGFWTTSLVSSRLANFNAAVITYTWNNKIYTQLRRLLHTAKMAAMFTLLGGRGEEVARYYTSICNTNKCK